MKAVLLTTLAIAIGLFSASALSQMSEDRPGGCPEGPPCPKEAKARLPGSTKADAKAAKADAKAARADAKVARADAKAAKADAKAGKADAKK